MVIWGTTRFSVWLHPVQVAHGETEGNTKWHYNINFILMAMRKHWLVILLRGVQYCTGLEL